MQLYLNVDCHVFLNLIEVIIILYMCMITKYLLNVRISAGLTKM